MTDLILNFEEASPGSPNYGVCDVTLMAILDGVLAGSILLCTPPDKVIIRWIFVEERYRGRKIAQGMIRAVRKRFSEHKIVVFVTAPELIPCFRLNGFVAKLETALGTNMVYSPREL
jgi:GNAT superfamily N-acetyltransferase